MHKINFYQRLLKKNPSVYFEKKKIKYNWFNFENKSKNLYGNKLEIKVSI